MNKETFPKIATEIIAGTLDVKRNCNEDYLKFVHNHLYTGSVIVPFNHIQLIDPLVIVSELRCAFGDNIQRLILPATKKFFDGRMGEPAKIGMNHLAQKYGLELLPIIQHYDENYTEEEKSQNYLEVFRKIIPTLKEPGTVVALSPEGTRSKTGNLIEAQKGIDLIVRKSPESIIQPISLSGMDKVMGQNYAFQQPEVTFCMPIQSADVSKLSKDLMISPHEYIMLAIAEQLPVKQRGFYGEDNYPWYYDLSELEECFEESDLG